MLASPGRAQKKRTAHDSNGHLGDRSEYERSPPGQQTIPSAFITPAPPRYRAEYATIHVSPFTVGTDGTYSTTRGGSIYNSSSAMSTVHSPETVFVVDRDASVCEAIRALLEPVGLKARRFGSAEEFLNLWDEDVPGCLVLEARLPGMTGMELQEKLANTRTPKIPIIFLAAHGDIPMVRKVMRAGAIDFLSKPFQKEELLAAIREAFEVDRARRRSHELSRPIQARFKLLTKREREVMRLVSAGMMNKQVAARLDLSEITVKLHRRHVMEKMRAKSLADIVRMADQLKKTEGRAPASKLLRNK
jgi:FixJ family two-component response regulator